MRVKTPGVAPTPGDYFKELRDAPLPLMYLFAYPS
jgi:hypothetical protein